MMVGVMGAPAGAVQSDVNAASPPAFDLVTASNAMLRPSDVPAAVTRLTSDAGEPNEFLTGYNTSYVGNEWRPVCSAPATGLSVFPPLKGTIVYQAAIGGVYQYVYAYPSTAAAVRAWRTLSSDIRSKCNGTSTSDGFTSFASSTRLPEIGSTGGWGVESSMDNEYSAVHLVGAAIQMIGSNGNNGEKAAAKRGRVAAVNALSARLGRRWLDRATLPVTQNPLITQAASTMLQPADLTAATPTTQPSKGGQSDFFANVPGVAPRPCNSGSWEATTEMLKSNEYFGTGQGGSGEPFVRPGEMSQSVYAYGSAVSAKLAWSQVTRDLVDCRKNVKGPIPAGKEFERTETGVSPVAFAGASGAAVPGLWLRNLRISDSGVSQKAYDLYLLVDNVIQKVTYSRGVKGMKQVPLDQEAVNALAVTLAQRWVAATPPPKS